MRTAVALVVMAACSGSPKQPAPEPEPSPIVAVTATDGGAAPAQEDNGWLIGAPPKEPVPKGDLENGARVEPAKQQTEDKSQASIAKRLNDEGKLAMVNAKYEDATRKFREAVARVPEPGYFFNLCASLFQEGKFSEGLTACNAVLVNDPAPALRAKAEKLAGRIKDEAKHQGIDVAPGAP